MSVEEWFRGPMWDVKTRVLFDQKLSRARGQRSEYLRIKGLGLVGSDDPDVREAGRGLLRQVIAESAAETAAATMAGAALAESLARDGFLEEAAACFERSLRGCPNVHVSSEVGLSEVIVAAEWTDRYGEAERHLASSRARTDPFPATRYRWHVVVARLAERQGRTADCALAAQAALACLAEGESPFPRHRDVGLATADETTVRELERLARPTRFRRR